ncbi:MAG TPA: GNAT family N-acetyltransferase [Candidatus Cybelea sp.]|nr:GNAT family N-acetyltransferase [Candidatus Cybelea sp.]
MANPESVVVRQFEQRDIAPCGRICYEAFRTIAQRHGFPPDLPSAEAGAGIMETLYGSDGFYGVVAERDDEVIGSNWLDERGTISGIGPVTIDPAVQDEGLGRRLMEAVIERSDVGGFPAVRLVQAAYHARSLSLYTKLGFASREELAVMDGDAADSNLTSYAVRPLRPDDLPACNEICVSVHGFDRGAELAAAGAANSAFVAERDGAIRAYTSGLGYFGHCAGETTDAICALLLEVPRLPSLGVLVPIRNYRLFRWCLDHGMRVLMTMTLMSRGLYQEPSGPYLPSILY